MPTLSQGFIAVKGCTFRALRAGIRLGYHQRRSREDVEIVVMVGSFGNRASTRAARRFGGSVLVAALLTSVSFASGCGTEPASNDASATSRATSRLPDIVFVVLCTFRYAHMGAAGYDRDTTPFLDSLGASGLFFENAVSASSWTKPAAASLLTGLTPNVHRMTDYYGREKGGTKVLEKRILGDDVVTLAETLRDAGYATVARINNVHVSEHFNLTQGFDDAISNESLNAKTMVAELARVAREIPHDQPLFFFLMSRDPHVTFDPHYVWYERFNRADDIVPREEYRTYTRALRKQVAEIADAHGELSSELLRRYVDLYDAELAQQDDALAGIPVAMRAAGREDDAIYVITADHGERFYEHGYIGHGGRLDEASVHVPLIFSGPGLPREVLGTPPTGRREVRVVRSIDVYPTLAALANAASPEGLLGRNLLDPNDTVARTAFASVDEVEHLVRDGSYQLYRRRDGSIELYDLERDRGEREDLASERTAVRARLQALVDDWLERERGLRNSVAAGERRPLPTEAVEQLRDLGYVE